MADFRVATAVRRSMGDAATNLVDAGSDPGILTIYDGTVPTSVNDGLSDQTALASLTMSDPAFAATDSTGVAEANAITADSSADATGTASFFRIADGDGVVRFQGDVTATDEGGDLELSTTAIQAGVEVSISSLTLTVPEA